MNTTRELEMTATVGDYDNGDGAKVDMSRLGVTILTDRERITGTMEWPVWDALVAEVARYRRAVEAASADVAVLPVERGAWA